MPNLNNDISTKLEISFSNIDILCKTGRWKMLADIEGRLIVSVGQCVFLNEEGMLILELASALIRWIKKIKSGMKDDFFYESMDYEDQPILAFQQNSDSSWRIYSVWQEADCDDTFSLKEIIISAKKYIVELTDCLKDNFEIDFLSFLESESET